MNNERHTQSYYPCKIITIKNIILLKWIKQNIIIPLIHILLWNENENWAFNNNQSYILLKYKSINRIVVIFIIITYHILLEERVWIFSRVDHQAFQGALSPDVYVVTLQQGEIKTEISQMQKAVQ